MSLSPDERSPATKQQQDGEGQWGFHRENTRELRAIRQQRRESNPTDTATERKYTRAGGEVEAEQEQQVSRSVHVASGDDERGPAGGSGHLRSLLGI